MPIVRSDRRADARTSFKESHDNLRQTLLSVDAQQANLEDLELGLGLASEAELDARDRLCVMHFRPGDAEGHTLDVCADMGCHDKSDADISALLDDAEDGADGSDTDPTAP